MAQADVTGLSYTNDTQSVQLGSAMTAASATATGTPYYPQLRGEAATLTGPAGSGALAPSTTFTFPGAGPSAVVQATTGDFYVLDAPNIHRITKATGAVNTLTLTSLPGAIASDVTQLGIDGNDNLYVQTARNSTTIYQLVNPASGSPTLGATITMAFGVATFTVSSDSTVYGLGYANLGVELGTVYRAVVGSAVTGSVSGPAFFPSTSWPNGGSFFSGFPLGIALNSASSVLYIATGGGGVFSLSNLAGSPTSGDAAEVSPDWRGSTNQIAVGISVDAAENVYLAIGNCLRFIPGGTGSSTASIVLSGPSDCLADGYDNGAANDTRFSFYASSPLSRAGLIADRFPAGSGTGDLYVGDFGNKALRKVAASGYSISPALQSGLSLASDGAISGTPTGVSPVLSTSNNTQAYTVTYTNLSRATATATVSLTFVTPPTALALSASTATLGVGTAMTAITVTTAAGSAALGLPAPTFTVSPTLPAGLSLDPTTGTISGTPTAAAAATTYTVTATNAYGSTSATVQLTVVSVLPPDQPQQVIGAAGNGQLTAIVTPSPTGPAATSYVFNAYDSNSPGASLATCTATAPATSCDLTGLTNGTDYNIEVVAVNSGGSSPAQTVFRVAPEASPTQAPASPQNPIAVAGNSSATISVSPNATSSRPAPSSYTVTSSPGGLSCTVTGSGGSCTVTGLTNGTAYTFTAVATNSFGSSLSSGPSNSVTPSGSAPTPGPNPGPAPVAPSAPTSVSVASGANSATVTWSAPASAGSFAVTQYRAVASPGGASCLVPASTTSCTLTGLTNGTTYTVSVSALSGAGWGAAATSAPFTPGNSAPATPAVSGVLAGNGSATVTVAAGSGGGAVTSYLVTASPGGATCTVTAPASNCVVTGLTNGTAYTFTATATGPGGTSAASAASSSVTPVAPITPTPAPLPAPLAPGQANLQQGGQVVPGVSVTPNQASTGLNVTGPGFTMSLQGENANGRPLALDPDGVLVLEEDRTLRTSGTGFFPGSQVDLYADPTVVGDGSMLRVGAGATYLGTVSVDSLGDFDGTVIIDPSLGVGDHVVQAIGVTQSNQERAMSLGVRIKEKQASRPGPVRDLKLVSKTSTSAKVSWLVPADDGGSPITKYKVRHRLKGEEKYQGRLTVTGLSATVKGLTPGKLYYIRVKAVNDVGTGPSDKLVKVRLPKR